MVSQSDSNTVVQGTEGIFGEIFLFNSWKHKSGPSFLILALRLLVQVHWNGYFSMGGAPTAPVLRDSGLVRLARVSTSPSCLQAPLQKAHKAW